MRWQWQQTEDQKIPRLAIQAASAVKKSNLDLRQNIFGESEGFVAVKKVEESRARRARSVSSEEGQRRRGRPPKQRETSDGSS
jgi:hypothetical protein